MENEHSPDEFANLEPKRVAIVGPDLDARGGIASVCRTWLGAPGLRGITLDYVPTMRDEGTGPRRAAGMLARQARFVGRIASAWRPDLFHIHLSWFSSFYRKMAYFEEAHATGRPVLVHVHTPDLEHFRRSSRIHGSAMRWMFGRAARVIALSEAMATELREIAGPEPLIDVLYNPVALENFDCSPRGRQGPPRLLFMGEVGERKGSFDLVKALQALQQEGVPFQARFCGNGDLERLQREVAGMGDAVAIPGWVSGKERLAEYRNTHLVVLPSYQEGLPMTILEAMAAGLPVVSTPIAGIPEAVEHERTGILVKPGDIAGLQAALRRLLTNPGLRERMGAAGRHRAEQHFDVDVVVARLREIWGMVVREHARKESIQ